MFAIEIDDRGNRFYYAKRNDGYWYRWYEGETNRPEYWHIVPHCGY